MAAKQRTPKWACVRGMERGPHNLPTHLQVRIQLQQIRRWKSKRRGEEEVPSVVSSIFLEFMSLEYWNWVKEVEIGEMTYIIQSLSYFATMWWTICGLLFSPGKQSNLWTLEQVWKSLSNFLGVLCYYFLCAWVFSAGAIEYYGWGKA